MMYVGRHGSLRSRGWRRVGALDATRFVTSPSRKFLIRLPSVTGQEAYVLAERPLRACFRQVEPVTAGFGVATTGRESEGVFFHRLDRTARMAKAEGRNWVEVD